MKPPRRTSDVLSALDEANALVGNALGKASVGATLHPDAAFRNAALACERELHTFSSDLGQDRELYDLLAGLDVTSEDGATKLWVGRTLQAFRRSGVDQEPQTREKVRLLHRELEALGAELHRNAAEDVRKIQVHPGDMLGLPQDYVKARKPGPRGQVLITTQLSDYLPFMSYAKRPQAREALWRAYRRRAPQNDKVLKAILAKRHELATLVGQPSWAAYQTQVLSIPNPAAVNDLLDSMNALSRARAEEDLALLLARKRKDLPSAKQVEPWEMDYYEDRLRLEKVRYDAVALTPYFELSRVKQGVLDQAGALFGVELRRTPRLQMPAWQADVESYEVWDTSPDAGKAAAVGSENPRLLGRIHLDLQERPDKPRHAAELELVVGQAGKRLPEAVVMATLPTPGETPALLTHGQVESLFHELGHALHHVFSGRNRWSALSGIRLEADVAEVPSLMLQEWMSDPAVLRTFAKHHKTNAELPEQLVHKLLEARDLGTGLRVRRQLYLAALSLRLHDGPPPSEVTDVATELQTRFLPFRSEVAPGTHFHTTFAPFETTGAAAYGYVWSTALAKDLLTAFDETGLSSPELGLKFRREVLEPGGSRPALELFQAFLGRPSSTSAFADWVSP